MVDYDNVLVVYYDRVLVLCEQELHFDLEKGIHMFFSITKRLSTLLWYA